MRSLSPRTCIVRFNGFGSCLLLGCVIGLFGLGCGGADDRAPRPDYSTSVNSAGPQQQDPAPNPDEPCTEGEEKACRVVLPSQGSVENCFVGVKTCVDGSWSNCHDPDEPPTFDEPEVDEAEVDEPEVDEPPVVVEPSDGPSDPV